MASSRPRLRGKAGPADPLHPMSQPAEKALVCVEKGCDLTNADTKGQLWHSPSGRKNWRCNGCNTFNKRRNDALAMVSSSTREAFEDSELLESPLSLRI